MTRREENNRKILELLETQPLHTWSSTQRELAITLGLSQSELSIRLKDLRNQDKIHYGKRLMFRGKNHEIVLSNNDEAVASRAINEPTVSEEIREKPINGAVVLNTLTDEQLGIALKQFLRQSIDSDIQHRRIRSEQDDRIRTFREELSAQRTHKTRLLDEKERLESELESQKKEVAALRGKYNELLIQSGTRTRRPARNGYAVHEVARQDDKAVLNFLKGGEEISR